MPYIDWLGKDDVINHHKNIPYKTISCKEEIGDKNSENMIIKGDNLLALKSLLPYYANSVKMIYIDPPYNTGNTSWVYNDNMDSPLIKKWLNKTVNEEDLSKSDKWLCMMYPRLKLLKELLKEDGVIFISIDDEELNNLTMICYDIFGKNNLISQFIWQKKKGGGNDSKHIAIEHEYILMFAKNKDKVGELTQNYTLEYAKRYKEKDSEGRFYWDTFKRKSGKQYYPITCPDGSILEYDEKGNKLSWLRSENRFYSDLEKQEIKFEKNKNGWTVFFKQRMPKGKTPRSILYNNGTTSDGSSLLLEIFNKNIFENPKPIELIKFFIQICTKSNDIILDSFAGSGTTAHAVLEQNKEDTENRKFILIEMLDYAKDITAKRVKKVIEGYSFTGKRKTLLFEKKLTKLEILKPDYMEKLSSDVNEIVKNEQNNYSDIDTIFKENTLKIEGIKDIETFKEGLGGGFKYCELVEDIFDEMGELNPKLTFEDISKHIYFVEFKKPICKKDILNPFVGSYKKEHLYFFENRFKVSDMKKILKKHDEYNQIIVYTKRTTISEDELKANSIVIRYIPYDIKDN